MNWLQRLFDGGGRKPAPAVAATLKKETGNLYVLRLGGVLNKATVDRIQAIGAQEIARGAKELKVLIILGGFEGWQRGADWGDLDFFARYGNDIARIAAVGEARWRDQTMLFLLDGRRQAEVRYFTPEQESQARTWLTR